MRYRPGLLLMTQAQWPQLGCGVGLRREHYDYILTHWPQMDWFEAVSENFMDTGGRPLKILEQVRSRYPVALHGVALSLGSSDAINTDYLRRLKRLVDHIQPEIISDHLCWSGVDGQQLHDLLPLPYTEEALNHVIGRIDQVQTYLGKKILIENVSTYVTYTHSAMSEWEFLRLAAARSGCGILLDLNNLYVNAVNHGFNPKEYLERIPGHLVGQFHLAGHTDKGKFLFDTHSADVLSTVWDLYEEALKRWGPVSTLIERDEQIPPFEELAAEVTKAEMIYGRYKNVSKPDAEKAMIHLDVPKKEFETGPDLRKVQLLMKNYIRPSQEKDDPGPGEGLLNSQGGDPGWVRMKVYSEGYTARVRDGLRDVYEAVFHLLGEGAFLGLAMDYAQDRASQDYNLSRIGKHLPEFLSTHTLAKNYPFLQDLASMEWAVSESFHAQDRDALDNFGLSVLGTADPESVKISFQPSVRLVRSEWPILDLWNVRKIPVADVNIPLVGRSQQVLIWRENHSPKAESVNRIAYLMLQELLAGNTLGQVCGRLAEFSEVDIPVSEWLMTWVRRAMITGIRDVRITTH